MTGIMAEQNEIAKILLNCEKSGAAPPYIISDDTYKEQKRGILKETLPVYSPPVRYNAEGAEIFIVSDLHIASGRNSVGIFRGTENFFADDCFKRFLKYAKENKKTDKAVLILNGDVLDFIRVTEYPGKVRKPEISRIIKGYLTLEPIKMPRECEPQEEASAFNEWYDLLLKLGIPRDIDTLTNISKKEKAYGLETNDYKSVWKLHVIEKGHKDFFDTLAEWLREGNKIVITKGNHDPEWCWLAVRNHFRLIMTERIAGTSGKAVKDVLNETVLPRITFVDDSMIIDKELYVEHGHRYDKNTMILKEPFYKGNQLNIPFGSFFNRYLVNRVELYLPYYDNIRPSGNFLPVLIKENFPLGLKVLFAHIPLTIRMAFTFNGRYIWFMFKKVFFMFFVLLLPIVLFFLSYSGNIEALQGLHAHLKEFYSKIVPDFLEKPLLNLLRGFGSLFLSYALARFVGWLQTEQLSSLDNFAIKRNEGSGFRLMTMGHTHNPGQYLFDSGTRFFNTGTWIPIIENSTAEVREDKTYVFLHLERDSSGRLVSANNNCLQRWNDDACRPETLVLVQRK